MTVSAAEKARRARAAAKAAAAPPASSEPTPPPAKTASPTGPKVAARELDDSLGKKILAPIVFDQKPADGVSETARTVVVVCKMPRGLYLQLTEFVMQDVRVVGGGVEKRRMPMRVGGQIRLKPSVLPFGAIPNYPIVDGFSLTHVDANFWRQYYQQNQNLSMIESGLLCAFDNEPEATAYCREYANLQHGLEPLEQKNDPRIEKSSSPNVTDIDIDTDTPRPKA